MLTLKTLLLSSGSGVIGHTPWNLVVGVACVIATLPAGTSRR
jgi:hypothetical protein